MLEGEWVAMLEGGWVAMLEGGWVAQHGGHKSAAKGRRGGAKGAGCVCFASPVGGWNV